jgi:hypothetical protein
MNVLAAGAGVECHRAVDCAHCAFEKLATIVHPGSPFANGARVRLETEQLSLWKDAEKTNGVVTVVGAEFQDNRRVGPDHVLDLVHRERARA